MLARQVDPHLRSREPGQVYLAASRCFALLASTCELDDLTANAEVWRRFVTSQISTDPGADVVVYTYLLDSDCAVSGVANAAGFAFQEGDQFLKATAFVASGRALL
jgi:hypothetical protein